jgi:hypothetical protein
MGFQQLQQMCVAANNILLERLRPLNTWQQFVSSSTDLADTANRSAFSIPHNSLTVWYLLSTASNLVGVRGNDFDNVRGTVGQ